MARSHTTMCVQTLAGIARAGTSEDARCRAAGLLLERGWGKPAQPMTGPDGEGGIEITIRNILEGKQ